MKKLSLILVCILSLTFGSCTMNTLLNQYSKQFTKAMAKTNDAPFLSCIWENKNTLVYTVNPNSEFGKTLMELPSDSDRNKMMETFFKQYFSNSQAELGFLTAVVNEGGHIQANLQWPNSTRGYKYSIYGYTLYTQIPH